MVHMILAVLRVIGIVLLVLLCVLAALICLVLFAPLRYRICVKTVEDDGKIIQKARVTWLFHLFSFLETYEKGELHYEMRLFGRKLRKHGGGPRKKGRLKKKKEKTAEESADKWQTDRETGQGAVAGRTKTHSTASENTAEDRILKTGEKQSAGRPTEHARKEDSGKEKRQKSTEGRKQASENMKHTGSDKQASENKKHTGARRISLEPAAGLIRKAAAFLTEIIPVLFDIIFALEDGLDKVENKIDALKAKIGPFISENAGESYALMWKRLKKLLYHYRIRKAEGYIYYGFDDPALTGKTAGLLYLVLPAGSEKFDVEPDFQEKALKADAVLCGHIRLNHAAAALISLMMNKQFRQFLKGIKHRGGNRNG